jgi:3-methyl-2-oxobutanoate hydroxymethyltransferase
MRCAWKAAEKPMSEDAPVTTSTLLRMKERGEKISCATSYDASFTRLLEDAGIDVLLVGDSLGMVIQGHESTLPVTVQDMVYHAACVARCGERALRIVDMPFMSYASTSQALANAARLMREGGAHMVKLEGGQTVVDAVRALVEHGIPVCAHLGLTPQSVHQLGGYRVQGRDSESAARLLQEARLLQSAGASLLVLECIPSELAGQVSASLQIPTIGIGAGPDCDGQVLVLYDLLGITPGKRPRFSHNFLEQAQDVPGALKAFVDAVRCGEFPRPEHGFS